GGIGPYTYAITAGSVPAGLTFNAATGVLSGIPTTGGTVSAFTITATDTGSTGTGAPFTASQTYVVSITPAGFTYDVNTKTLTITGKSFMYSESTTADNA